MKFGSIFALLAMGVLVAILSTASAAVKNDSKDDVAAGTLNHGRQLKKKSNEDDSKSKSKGTKTPKSKGNKSTKGPTSSPTMPPTPITKPLIHFTSGDLEIDPALLRRVDIANSLGGNLDGRFIDYNDRPFISLEECQSLKKFADQKLEEALLLGEGSTARGGTGGPASAANLAGTFHPKDNITEDFLYHLTPDELKSMVNMESITAMYNTLRSFNPEYPVSRISLRRTNNAGNKHIRYHIDGPSTVMHVWLNDNHDEQDLEGGKYLFLGREGTTKIDNIPGLAIVHGDGIVHGVAAFKGVRYTLLLVGDHKDSTDILEPICNGAATAA